MSRRGDGWAEDALELHRQLGDAWGATFSCSWSPTGGREGRRWAGVRNSSTPKAHEGFRECGDEHYVLRATRSLGWAYYRGRRPRTRARALRGEPSSGERGARRVHTGDVAESACRHRRQRTAVRGRRLDADGELSEVPRARRSLHGGVHRRPLCQRPRPRGASSGRCAGSLEFDRPPRGDRRSPPSLAKVNEKTLTSIRAATRRCRCRRSLGARPGTDRRRGRRARPRLTPVRVVRGRAASGRGGRRRRPRRTPSPPRAAAPGRPLAPRACPPRRVRAARRARRCRAPR